MSKKKAGALHAKKEVVRVEGSKPMLMSQVDQIALRAKIERYISIDFPLYKLLQASLITRAEYGRLEAKHCDRCGLSMKSIYRNRFDS